MAEAWALRVARGCWEPGPGCGAESGREPEGLLLLSAFCVGMSASYQWLSVMAESS